MGRRLSSDRIRKTRHTKNKIIIAVEGTNKTERNYFNNFDDGRQPYSISIAHGNDTDPLKLVKRVYKEIEKMELNLCEGDEAYCVFDTDIDIKKNKEIEDAIKFANEKGIKIITSSPCIELWFLLHFKYTTASLSNDEVLKKLKTFYPKYEKNIDDFDDINKNIYSAIKRAKKLEKYQLDNGNKIGRVETNPNTEMYKIVEHLLNSKVEP